MLDHVAALEAAPLVEYPIALRKAQLGYKHTLNMALLYGELSNFLG